MCETVDSQTLNISSIFGSDLLSVGFYINYIKNAKLRYNISEREIEIYVWKGGEIVHKGLINGNQTDRYGSHTFSYVNIEGSRYTVTNTTYKFTFTNGNHVIARGSSIVIIFPDSLKFLSGSPTISNIVNLDNILTTTISGQQISIRECFSIDVPNNSIIQFEIGDILNPYETGFTNSFDVNIATKVEGSTISSWRLANGLEYNIIHIAPFTAFYITIDSTITNQIANYYLNIQLGDAPLQTNHQLNIQTTHVEQFCLPLSHAIPDTFFISSTTHSPPNTYYFQFDTNIPAKASFQIVIKCRNPYTTRPSEDLILWATDSVTNKSFYNGSASIPDMDELNNFSSLSIIFANYLPKALNTFDILITDKKPSPITQVDEIEVRVSRGMEVVGCSANNILGISGPMGCTFTENVITITEIIELSPNIGFRLENIVRNPEDVSNAINFTICTKSREGYSGICGSSIPEAIICNFPCFSCSSSYPDECHSCYLQTHEVFQGGETYQYFYSLTDSSVQ